MMFEILTKPFGTLTSYVLQNKKSGERLQVIPELGGHVAGLWLAKDGKLVQVVIGAETEEELIADTVYKSAWLFPWPNRIRTGRYRFAGTDYQLPINEETRQTALHGLVAKLPFTVSGHTCTQEFAELTLEHNYDGIEPGYPFPFRVQLTLRLLLHKGFACKVNAQNTGLADIPFGAGWHPYFSLNQTINNLTLQLPEGTGYLIDEQMIPVGTSGPHGFTKPTVLGTASLDDCYKITSSDSLASTRLTNQEENLTLELWQDAGPGKFNYLQVYTPPHRQTICMEPVSCGIDAFNNKEGLLILKPEEKFSASFGVQLT